LIEERIGRRRWIQEESDVVRVARIDYGGVGAILNERWLRHIENAVDWGRRLRWIIRVPVLDHRLLSVLDPD